MTGKIPRAPLPPFASIAPAHRRLSRALATAAISSAKAILAPAASRQVFEMNTATLSL
jgi:hypothetical protein